MCFSFGAEYLELDEFQEKQRSKLITAVAATESKSLTVIFKLVIVRCQIMWELLPSEPNLRDNVTVGSVANEMNEL